MTNMTPAIAIKNLSNRTGWTVRHIAKEVNTVSYTTMYAWEKLDESGDELSPAQRDSIMGTIENINLRFADTPEHPIAHFANDLRYALQRDTPVTIEVMCKNGTATITHDDSLEPVDKFNLLAEVTEALRDEMNAIRTMLNIKARQ